MLFKTMKKISNDIFNFFNYIFFTSERYFGKNTNMDSDNCTRYNSFNNLDDKKGCEEASFLEPKVKLCSIYWDQW